MGVRLRRGILAFQMVASLMFLILEGVHGTQTASPSWLDPIPPSLRERLANKIQSYVEYERNGEYEKLYELLRQPNSESFTMMSKETYARLRRDSSLKIVDMRPLLSEYDRERNIYSIQLEVDFQANGKLTKEIQNINATLYDGDWYLSQPYVTLGNPGDFSEPLTTIDPILTNSPQKVKKPFR